jgi:hypothetical protein
MTAIRPKIGIVADPGNLEADVRECVCCVLRMLRHGHDAAEVIEALVEWQPTTVRLEVESRVHQLIWRPQATLNGTEYRAWVLD